MSVDLIKDNKIIRQMLKQRFDELKLSLGDIVDESTKLKHIGINKASLSKYLSDSKVRGSLTQQSVIWLCMRYGVTFYINVERLQEYDEVSCLKRVNYFFGKGKK